MSEPSFHEVDAAPFCAFQEVVDPCGSVFSCVYPILIAKYGQQRKRGIAGQNESMAAWVLPTYKGLPVKTLVLQLKLAC